MSLQALAAVLEADVGDVYAKMLLVCLANAHNMATGECYPSIARLCRESNIGETTVRDRLAWLGAEGLITKRVNFDPATGRQLAHSYTLNFIGEGSPGEGREGPPGEGGRVRPAGGQGPRPARGGRVRAARGGRVRAARGGGFALANPSKEDTGINTKEARARPPAREATTKVSSIAQPALFAECERLHGKGVIQNREGAWFFPAALVERASRNLEQSGEWGRE